MNRTSSCPVLKFQKMRIGWPHPGVVLQSCLIKEGYLDNFNKDSCEIKILYGGTKREYGGRGRICPKMGF